MTLTAEISLMEQDCILTTSDGENLKVEPWLPLSAKESFIHLSAINVLQYLTTMEADLALLNWFKVLSIGGEITVAVPDADYYMHLWREADWNEDTLRDPLSTARVSFSGLWGTQQNGNPRDVNYSEANNGAFQSAYNERRLRFLLSRAGFVDVKIDNDGAGKLCATALKSMSKGERQVATDLRNIRPDHLNRYEFASTILAELRPSRVLDCACGIGYGTRLLSDSLDAHVTGADIDSAAINFAKEHYGKDLIEFVNCDARTLPLKPSSVDAVVSFETIEHVDFDEALLQQFHTILRPGGTLICSTPNESVMPFDKQKFRFHIKHYTNEELVSMLKKVGFEHIELYCQQDPVAGKVIPGANGCFTIVVCERAVQ